jgi:hypothetical protein
MTASMAKTEENRLNTFVWASDDQPKNRETLPPKSKIRSVHATNTTTTAQLAQRA